MIYKKKHLQNPIQDNDKIMKRSCSVTIVNYSLNKIEDTCRITSVRLVLLIYFKLSAKNTDIFTFSGRRQDLLLFTI